MLLSDGSSPQQLFAGPWTSSQPLLHKLQPPLPAARRYSSTNQQTQTTCTLGVLCGPQGLPWRWYGQDHPICSALCQGEQLVMEEHPHKRRDEMKAALPSSHQQTQPFCTFPLKQPPPRQREPPSHPGLGSASRLNPFLSVLPHYWRRARRVCLLTCSERVWIAGTPLKSLPTRPRTTGAYQRL